jgi:hypothetical protein
MDKIVISCGLIIIILSSLLAVSIYEKSTLSITDITITEYQGYKALKVSLYNMDNSNYYNEIKIIGDENATNHRTGISTQFLYLKNNTNNDIMYIYPIYLSQGEYKFRVENFITTTEKSFIIN